MAKPFTRRFRPGRWILMLGILMFDILMFGVAFTRRLAYRVQSDTHPALEHTRRSAPKVWRQARSIQSRLPSMHEHEQKRRQESANRFPSPGVSLIRFAGLKFSICS
jgi:hypothetical protein